MCIEVVVLSKVHWERVEGPGNAKRIGYCPFSSLCCNRDYKVSGLYHERDFSVIFLATEFSGSMSR